MADDHFDAVKMQFQTMSLTDNWHRIVYTISFSGRVFHLPHSQHVRTRSKVFEIDSSVMTKHLIHRLQWKCDTKFAYGQQWNSH